MWVGRGDTILTSLPYASILYPEYRALRCSHCYAEPPCPGLSCELCDEPSYCSRRCQEAAAPTHLLECGLESPSCPTTGLLLLRAWLRWASEWGGERVEEGVPGVQKTRRFTHFLSHSDELRKSQKTMGDIRRYHDDLTSVLGDEAPKFDQFVELYGKVIVNDFELSQAGSRDSIGMGVYLAPSILDHSCQPTAWVEFLGNTLVLRSKGVEEPCRQVDQEKVDMSAVTISYLDTREPSAEVRRSYLSRHYFFTCLCPRCHTGHK